MQLDHVQERVELLELDTSEGFCENAGDHIIGRTVFDGNVILGNGLKNKMEVNLDVFGVSMEFWVLQKLDCTLVVARLAMVWFSNLENQVQTWT